MNQEIGRLSQVYATACCKYLESAFGIEFYQTPTGSEGLQLVSIYPKVAMTDYLLHCARTLFENLSLGESTYNERKTPSNSVYERRHPVEVGVPSLWRSFRNQEAVEAIERALGLASMFGTTDGADHKAWVIDQMVRALAGEGYEEFVRKVKDGEDGPDTYEWNEGVAP